MTETLTIRLRNKKAIALLKNLEELKVIEIVDERIPAHWPAKKKEKARDFLEALAQAKAAERGEVELKTLDELINEL